MATGKGIKQATSTTFCNVLQNCAESAVFAQCHSEAPTGAVRISTSIVLPETVTSIGSQAFFSTGVDSIYIKGQNVIDAIFVDDGNGIDSIAGGMLSYNGVPNIYIEKDVTLNQFLIDNYRIVVKKLH